MINLFFIVNSFNFPFENRGRPRYSPSFYNHGGLKLLVSNKINISSVNELLSGNKQSDIANNHGGLKWE